MLPCAWPLCVAASVHVTTSKHSAPTCASHYVLCSVLCDHRPTDHRCLQPDTARIHARRCIDESGGGKMNRVWALLAVATFSHG
jgi:hypothetical protein